MIRDPRTESTRAHAELDRPALVLSLLVAMRDGHRSVPEIAETTGLRATSIYRVLVDTSLFERFRVDIYGVRAKGRWRLTKTGQAIAAKLKGGAA